MLHCHQHRRSSTAAWRRCDRHLQSSTPSTAACPTRRPPGNGGWSTLPPGSTDDRRGVARAPGLHDRRALPPSRVQVVQRRRAGRPPVARGPAGRGSSWGSTIGRLSSRRWRGWSICQGFDGSSRRSRRCAGRRRRRSCWSSATAPNARSYGARRAADLAGAVHMAGYRSDVRALLPPRTSTRAARSAKACRSPSSRRWRPASGRRDRGWGLRSAPRRQRRRPSRSVPQL
jgi:hypothetical protein